MGGLNRCVGARMQASMLGKLDAAAKVAAEAEAQQWPGRRRVFQLGDIQLFLACEGKLDINARKMLGALDDEAQSVAVTADLLPALACRSWQQWCPWSRCCRRSRCVHAWKDSGAPVSRETSPRASACLCLPQS